MKINRILSSLLLTLCAFCIISGCSSGADDSVPKEGVNAGKDVPQQSVTPRTRPGEESGSR